MACGGRLVLPLVALVIVLATAGCTDDPLAAGRAAELERRLLVSCQCHPRKIDGLPLQEEIRSAIQAGIATGLDDDTILWNVLETHGTALLSAGIDDLEERTLAFVAETALMMVAGLGVLLLQLRRRP
jgi:hypothetical protein